MKVPPSRVTADIPILEEQHEAKRVETLKALESLREARRYALLQLQKTQILFTYLNWKQRESINHHCGGTFLPQKIYAMSAVPVVDSEFAENAVSPAPAKQTASYVQRVKILRKNIVQFGMVKARAEELSGAIVKSIAVFNHQYKAASRELFPLGVISKARRSLRRFFNHPYFSWGELGCLRNLGAAAGFVFKMAEAPLAGAR